MDFAGGYAPWLVACNVHLNRGSRRTRTRSKEFQLLYAKKKDIQLKQKTRIFLNIEPCGEKLLLKNNSKIDRKNVYQENYRIFIIENALKILFAHNDVGLPFQFLEVNVVCVCVSVFFLFIYFFSFISSYNVESGAGKSVKKRDQENKYIIKKRKIKPWFFFFAAAANQIWFCMKAKSRDRCRG